jgi:putative component of toxin-antitoxin plasmid stabilization module
MQMQCIFTVNIYSYKFIVICIIWDTIMVCSIQVTEVFEDWFKGLKDRMVKARIQARIDRAEDGNFGDSQHVGDGVSEMRLHFGAGWRVY